MQEIPQNPVVAKDTPLFVPVFQRISKSLDCSIPFSEFMDLALYDDLHGYYAQPELRKIGRKGDFYTSVAVGDTFGFLLAHAILRAWNERFEIRESFVVVEQGAHDGQLARDIVAGLREITGTIPEGFQYRILEPRSSVRTALKSRLAEENLDKIIQVVTSFAEAAAPQGIFLCNELLDAFPVQLLAFEEGRWCEKQVGYEEKSSVFVLVSRPLDPALADFTRSIGDDFPEGYRTEFCPGIEPWITRAASLFSRGLWWIIDYGHDQPDYYRPDRSAGTLRCYHQHHAGEDPFFRPGEQDITAHVDFTRLGELAEKAGLMIDRYRDQHHFLIDSARPWLLSVEGRAPDARLAKRLRQFQTLTHPAMMGQQFKVMELRSGLGDKRVEP